MWTIFKDCFVLKIFICLFFIFTNSVLEAQNYYESLPKLRIFAIYDSDDESLGESVKADAETLQSWVDNYFRSDNYPKLRGRATYHTLGLQKGFEITPEKIRGYFRNYPLEGDEALLIYYSGHGAYKANGDDAGQLLKMSGGDISEREILRMVDAPTTIFVIDACSSLVRRNRDSNFTSGRGTFDARDKSYTKKRPLIAKNIENLFFQPRGKLVLRAAHPGETAWAHSSIGGIFTDSLFGLHLSARGVLALNEKNDGHLIDWQDVMKGTYARTKESFEKIKSDAQQRMPEQKFHESSIGKAKAQRPIMRGELDHIARSKVFLTYFGEYQFNSELDKWEQEIEAYYTARGRRRTDARIGAFYYYPNKKRVNWFEDGSTEPIPVTDGTVFKMDYDNVMGSASFKTHAFNLKGFPKKDFKVRIEMHNKKTGVFMGSSDFFTFSTGD